MARIRVQKSAGGVIYQERDGQMWVALIATKGGGVWGLPKGLVETGEEPLQAALREVKEEAGLEGEPVDDLGYIEYWYRDSAAGILYHKFVHYALLAQVTGDVSQHDWEVDEARWFAIEDAVERASYDNEKEVLVRAREAWRRLSTQR